VERPTLSLLNHDYARTCSLWIFFGFVSEDSVLGTRITHFCGVIGICSTIRRILASIRKRKT
jgi:hypothetical protein